MFLFYSLFQWEHQLFCYDWLFYKCFSVPFCRNVLTRSGYWLLITQLNCLYCTTDFLALTWPESFVSRAWFFSSASERWSVVKIVFKRGDSSSCGTRYVKKKKKRNTCKYHISLFIIVNILGAGSRKLKPCRALLTAECIWHTCEFWNE